LPLRPNREPNREQCLQQRRSVQVFWSIR
jgi:hypothetical protein